MEKENTPASKRLYSLDALRGFDMFWIMGGEGIFRGLILVVLGILNNIGLSFLLSSV